MKKLFFTIPMILGLLTLSGCRFHAEECLKIKPVRSAKGQPANLTLTVQLVHQCKEDDPIVPFSGLDPKTDVARFVESSEVPSGKDSDIMDWLEELFKDEDLESKNASLAAPKVFTLRTLLLLDLSGSVVRDADKLGYLKKSSIEFARQALSGQDGAHHELNIYAFDGQEDIQEIVKSRSFSEIERAILDIQCPNARRGTCMDDSTNLYGAVSKGLDFLTQIERKGLSASNLVIFTDGIDRAGLAKLSDVQKEVEKFLQVENRHIYTVGLGKKINAAALASIGKSGYYSAENAKQLTVKFSEVAKAIRNISGSFFDIKYCSPKRQGQQKETLFLFSKLDKAHPKDNNYEYGSLDFTYNADDFAGGCDLEKSEDWQSVAMDRSMLPYDKFVEFCNYSFSPIIYVSVGYYSEGIPMSQGWFQVPKLACKRIAVGKSWAGSEVFYFARDKKDATWGDKDAGEEFCTNSSDFLFQGKQVKRCKGFFNSLQSMGRIKVDGPVGFKYFY